MRRFRVTLMAMVFLAGLTASTAAAETSEKAKLSRKWKAKNVVIVVVDGPRYSETWGDPKKQYTPHLAKTLAPQGVIYTNFKNQGNTSTIPGHTAVTTGFYQSINNRGKELPNNPTLLQRFLKHSGVKKEKAWLITTKDKLAVLLDSNAPAWKGKYRASEYCGEKGKGLGSGYGSDTDTLAKVKSVIQKEKPRLIVVNFKEPDSSGHAGNWEKYLKGIRDTDRYTHEIVAALAASSFYKNKTAFFLTNDHGRHLDGHKDAFKSHGDSCAGCRHILLYATGPDFKRGAIIAQEREQIDIAVTAAAILGFTIPQSKGKIMSEMLITE